MFCPAAPAMVSPMKWAPRPSCGRRWNYSVPADYKVRHVDVVQMDDGYFIQRLYVGIEPEEQTNRESKDKYGTFAYAIDSFHRAQHQKEVEYKRDY